VTEVSQVDSISSWKLEGKFVGVKTEWVKSRRSNYRISWRKLACVKETAG
jgi:hypothetical protein